MAHKPRKRGLVCVPGTTPICAAEESTRLRLGLFGVVAESFVLWVAGVSFLMDETKITDPAVAMPGLGSLLAYLDGLDGRADLAVIEAKLREPSVTREDLLPVCRFGDKAYKRNTIARGEHFELVCLCWRSGHCTPIHDHRGSACGFKVIEGVGTEIRFEETESGLICPVKTTRMEPGYVCVAGDEDIHQIANMQAAGIDLITLHLYTPPLSRINTWKFAQATVEECAGDRAGALFD